MRAVIDTNVLLSGLFWRGPPHAVIEQVRNGVLTWMSSPALMAELAETMVRPKFRAVLSRTGGDPDRMLAEIRLLAELIDPPPLPTPVSRDRDDDAVLALALWTHPDFIISGDGDLLVLGRYVGIPIVGPAQALAMIAAEPA